MLTQWNSAYRDCKKSWVSFPLVSAISSCLVLIRPMQMEDMKEQKRREGRGWFG